MPDGQVLEFTRVTKRFNDVTAVSDFSARIEPGVVTAFLGPNGAGKTTTLRILLGQVRPTSGSATIGGVAFADLRTPLRTIGSVLEETVYRPRRTAARQLTIAAKANGIPLSRVDEVLSLVGLDGEGEGRIGSFSLGMRQRLSVAHALLGDAGTLVFDEPANGLDPEGIRWMRLLMRRLADEGRTVIVSSHVLSEVEQVADHVLVLSKGKLMLSSGIESLADPAAGSVVVDAADRAALTTALASAGFEVEILRSGLTVRGGDAKTVGAVAASAGIALSTLVQRGPTLEDVFIELVRNGRFEPRPAIVAAPDAEAPALAVPAAAAVAPEVIAPDVVAPEVVAPDEWTAAVQSDAGEIAADADEAVEGDGAEADAEASVDPEPVIDPEPIAQAGPSFDDILFGAGSVTSDDGESVFDSSPSDSETHDEHTSSGIDIFARLGGVDFEERSEESDAVEAGAEEAGTEDAAAEDSRDEDSHSDDTDETSAESEENADSDEQHGDADADGDEDPRSAAVSSMLAAAARAYYDDEPKPYPSADALGEEHAQVDGHHEQADENSSDDQDDAGPHEDTPAENIEHDGGDDQHGEHQHGDDEHQHGDDEHGHDEHQHGDNEHRDNEHGHEHRDGDHHHG